VTAYATFYTTANTSGDKFYLDAAQFENGALTPYTGSTRAANDLTVAGALAVQGTIKTASSLMVGDVTIQSGTTGGNSYTLTLPTTVASSNQCLAAGTVTGTSVPLVFTSCGSGGGVTTVGSFSGTSIANGASISGSTITFGEADATNPGMLSTDAQTIAGDKTFNGDTTIAAGKVLNAGGDVNVGSASNRSGQSRLFSDGFESGNHNLWTTGVTTGGSSTITLDNTTVRNGKYSTKITNNNGAAHVRSAISGGGTTVARAYVYVDDQTSGDAGLMTLIGGSNNFALFRQASNGRLAYYNGPTSTPDEGSTVLTTDAWHKIELVLTIGSPASGAATVYLDDVAVLTLTGIDTGTTNPDTIRIGDTATNVGHVIYYDDVSVDVTRPGASANLNVNDSLHVAGTSSFGGAVLIQQANNTANAFRVQNASGTNLFAIDTSTSNITLGNGSGTFSLQTSNLDISTAGAITGATGLTLASGNIDMSASAGTLQSGTGAVSLNGDTTIAADKDLILASGNGTITQNYAADSGTAATINANATSGNTVTSGLNVAAGGAGTVTNGILVSRSSGTLDNGLAFSGTMTNLISSSNFTATSAGALTTASTIRSNTGFNVNGTAGSTVTCSSGNVLTDQVVVGGIVTGGTCAASGPGSATTLQDAYDNGTNTGVVNLNANDDGILLRDTAGGIGGNLFAVQNSGGTIDYLGLTASTFTLQNSSDLDSLKFDMSTGELRIYSPTSTSEYVRLYFDDTANEAVLAASAGHTTRVGNGSGNIALQLTSESDVLLVTRTDATLGGANSTTDFSFTSDLTGGSNAVTGNVMKVEAIGSGSNVTRNVLSLSQANSGAAGNLIYGATNGTQMFKIDVAGSMTLGANSTITSSSGTFAMSSNSGNLTLTAGGANKVIAKPGTNSTSSFEIQNATSTALFTVNTTNNRLQVGSSTTDATGVLLILDSSNVATGSGTEPTGVNGSMYYNTSVNKFRCYENSGWKDCISTALLSDITMMTPANANAAWTNQPAAVTEIFGTNRHRVYMDMTNATQARIVANIETANAVAGAVLCLQYSTDGSAWTNLDGSTGACIALGTTGTITSSWFNITAGAKGDYRLRLAGSTGGISTGDPAFGAIHAQFK
jgi:hypothetical protein